MRLPIVRCPDALRVGLAFVVFLVGVFGGWTFRDIAVLWSMGVAGLVLLLTSRTRTGFAICAIFALGCTAWAAHKTPDAFPLSTRVSGAKFRDAPVSSVLFHLAKQRCGLPALCFMVFDRDMADSTISVEIPDRCTLREALALVARSTHCEYSFQWWKGCGNAPRPVLALFRFAKPGATKAEFHTSSLFVCPLGIHPPRRQ